MRVCFFAREKMMPEVQSIINMANRLPKELWMAIIGRDFRVYNRLVRAIPGLSSLILTLVRALWFECANMMIITSGHDIHVVPALNGQIHTTRPFERFNFKLHARYGMLAFNDERPSIDQTIYDERAQIILRLTAYAQLGRLSRHDGPALRYFDAVYGCEIYAVDGDVSRVKCICITGHLRSYDINVKSMIMTVISPSAAIEDYITYNGFNYEKFAQHASRTTDVNMTCQNIDLIAHHAAMLTRVPVEYKHAIEICHLAQLSGK